jgi:hypothetical protein
MGAQCKGITKGGTPCKITITFANGYCRLHQDQYVTELPKDTEREDSSNKKTEINKNTQEIPTSKISSHDFPLLPNGPCRMPSKGKCILIFIGITIC